MLPDQKYKSTEHLVAAHSLQSADSTIPFWVLQLISIWWTGTGTPGSISALTVSKCLHEFLLLTIYQNRVKMPSKLLFCGCFKLIL